VGPVGPAGPASQVTGPTGRTGPTGPAGAAASNASRIKIGPSSQQLGSALSIANCDPGWHAVGGGMLGSALNTRLARIESVPTPTVANGVATGWLVRVDTMLPSEQATAVAYAICVPN
jgi:hypothetical protein